MWERRKRELQGQQFYIHEMELELGYADPAMPPLGPLIAILTPCPVKHAIYLPSLPSPMRLVIAVTGHARSGTVGISGHEYGAFGDCWENGNLRQHGTWTDYLTSTTFAWVQYFYIVGCDEGYVAVWGVSADAPS